MSVGALPEWAERIAEAFKAAGPDVVERTISGRRAYVVGDRLIGDVELGDNSLRVHLRLSGTQRGELAARAHLDPNDPGTLVIVTEADRDFALKMIPHAYDSARSARARAPESSRDHPRSVAPKPAAPRRRTAR